MPFYMPTYTRDPEAIRVLKERHAAGVATEALPLKVRAKMDLEFIHVDEDHLNRIRIEAGLKPIAPKE